MEHDVDVPSAGGLEGGLEALEEVGAAASALGAWPRGEVVTEMRVREEQEAHGALR